MTAGRYELVLRGELGDRFEPLFEGMRFERRPGRTVLTGHVRDQSQLHGLIERIAELGVELVSVNPIDRREEDR
jgi:outer membrane PBP1 activator LpoA protein